MTKHISQLLPVALKEIERNMETNKLLQESIENTIINNVDAWDDGVLEYDTVEKASSYIAEEIREIAVKFADWHNQERLERLIEDGIRTTEELFNDFINQRYGTK